MQLDLKTPFDQIHVFSQDLKNGALRKGGRAWLLQSLRRQRWIRIAQRQVLLGGEKITIPEKPELPEYDPENPDRHWPGVVLSLFLWPLRFAERILEQARQFYVWLAQAEEQQGLIQGLVSEDYQRLETAVDDAAEKFVRSERVRFGLEVIPKQVLLPGGEWTVPVRRKLRPIWVRETISAKTLVEIIQRDTFDLHTREFRALVKRVEELLSKNSDYVKSLYAYVEAETDDPDKRGEVFAERIGPLVDRLYKDFKALVEPARASTGKRIHELYEGLAALREKSWLRVRRRFFVVGFQRYTDQVREWMEKVAAWRNAAEQRFDSFWDERVKPALGVTQHARITTREYIVPHEWLREPDLPEDLVSLFQDRRNPALLEVPSPVLKMMKTVRDQHVNGVRGGGMLLCDSMMGGMGLLAYAMSLYFRDVRYRVYRHTHTRPLTKLPDFDTEVVLLENFERMVMLDRDNLSIATEVIEQLFESDVSFVIAVQYRVAERLRMAVPAFSRFPVELTFTKYDLDTFIAIIRRRMAISGYEFYAEDENEFWMELYRSASGLPGVGLDLFLRSLAPEAEGRFRMAPILPSVRSLFSGISVEELLLLRRVYRQPFLHRDAIPTRELPLLMMFESVGLVTEQRDHYALRRQFYGVVRDALQSRNL